MRSHKEKSEKELKENKERILALNIKSQSLADENKQLITKATEERMQNNGQD